MDAQSWHGSLKVVAFVVFLLMLSALGYAGYISVAHWNGIGV